MQNNPILDKTRLKTKTESDWIATAVSILSLGISSAVAYTSNFRKADIKLCFGRNIIIFPNLINTSSETITEVAFNLPLTFYNWSPQGGTIQRIRLVIGRQNHDDSYYDMAWTTFVKIGNTGNFEDDSLAQPVPLKGRSSINKIIRFDWSSEIGSSQFNIEAGNYEIRIYGWTKNTDKPDLNNRASFTLTNDQYQQFKNIVSQRSGRSIWVSLDENEKQNQLVSKNTITRLYSD